MEYLEHYFERNCSLHIFRRTSCEFFHRCYEKYYKKVRENKNSKRYKCLKCGIICNFTIEDDVIKSVFHLNNGKVDKMNHTCNEQIIKKLLE